MAVVTTKELKSTDVPTPQSLIELVERLETRERMVEKRMILRGEMGIRELENQRTANHKDFMSKSEDFIKEVKKLKEDLQEMLQTQKSKSKNLIDEIHTAYESGFVVLQDMIKGLRRSLTVNQRFDEILRLTKVIYQLLFKS